MSNAHDGRVARAARYTLTPLGRFVVDVIGGLVLAVLIVSVPLLVALIGALR